MNMDKELFKLDKVEGTEIFIRCKEEKRCIAYYEIDGKFYKFQIELID